MKKLTGFGLLRQRNSLAFSSFCWDWPISSFWPNFCQSNSGPLPYLSTSCFCLHGRTWIQWFWQGWWVDQVAQNWSLRGCRTLLPTQLHHCAMTVASFSCTLLPTLIFSLYSISISSSLIHCHLHHNYSLFSFLAHLVLHSGQSPIGLVWTLLETLDQCHCAAHPWCFCFGIVPILPLIPIQSTTI